jgi:hypothetical protein
MPSELLLFHKGLSYQARSALQEPGTLKTCANISLEKEGEQGLRTRFTAINTTPVGSIHSIVRWGNYVIIGDTTNLRHFNLLTASDFTNIYASFTNSPWQFREYKDFLHGVNGSESVLIDLKGNCFPARVENPGSLAAGGDGAAGNPSGHYMLYSSFYITWPNGMTYETGLSFASTDVNVSSKAIAWTAIPVSSHTSYAIAGADAFNKCQVLLLFNDADGATTFYESAKSRTVTTGGNAQIDTAQYFYNTIKSSLLLDGTADYITLAHSTDYNLSTTPFTIEFSVRFSAVTTDQGFFGKYQDATNYWYFNWTQATTTLQFKAVSTSTVADYTATWSPAINTNYHIEIDRSGATFKIFVNGTALTLTEATAISTNSMPATTSGDLEIGSAFDHASDLTGWMGPFALYSNLAKHTTNFTAPTTPPTAPAIWRKLYRGPGTGGTLSDIYYVGTIYDNTTTTYTDDASDATLAVSDASLVDDFEPLPISHFIEYHYGRAYGIDDANPHRICFTEVALGATAAENEDIMPLAFDSIAPYWDDLRVSGFSAVDPQGIIAWATNLFIPLKQTWIRKQGNDPDTWSYKKTWSLYGVGAPDTVAICPQPNGIIYVSAADGGNPGICVFNGQTSEMLTAPKLDWIFKSDLNHTYIANCRGFCAGRYYHLLYPSVDKTLTGIVFSKSGTDDVLGTYTNHGLVTNTTLTVSGCTQAYANAAWVITVTGRNTFTLNSASWTSFTGADVTGTGVATTGGVPNRWLAIDLRRFPDIRAGFWEGLNAVCGYGYDQGGADGVTYIGTTTGYVMRSDDDSTEAIDIDVSTEDRIGGDIKAANMVKTLKELKYNLNGTVNLQIIIDGTTMTWPDESNYQSITGTGDLVQVIKSFPQNFKGYTYRIRIYADDLTAFTIFSPWEMVFDIQGGA